VLRLLSGLPYHYLLLAVAIALMLIVWFMPFDWIENTFGLSGLLMLVFAVVAVKLHPDWHAATVGLLPTLPHAGTHETYLYLYFVVGIISSVMMPYEVYFYSSGAIEEGWQPKDLKKNTFICNVGFSLGSLLSISILIIGAVFFKKLGIIPELLGTSAISAPYVFGRIGLILGLLGFLFCISGSAVETCLAGAYNICQFYGQRWGRHLKPRQTPIFTGLWIVIFVIAMGIVQTGIDPIQLVEYSVIFAVVVLPLTYLPILLVAKNEKYMGKHVNSKMDTAIGWIFFVVVTVCALAAIPLMILTKMGKG
jgi:manganese transport protein